VLNYSLSQVVVGHTHVPHDGSTSTIDQAFVPDPSLVNSCNTIPPLSSSDHYGIVMELNKKPEKAAKAKGQLTWRYYADWNTARQLIDTFNWDSDYIELTVLEKNDTSNSCILCVKHYPAARLPH